MWKACSILWCCSLLVAQQSAAGDPVGEDPLRSLPSLLRRMDEGDSLAPQLRRLGRDAQAAALGLWALSPQPARVADFVEVFDEAADAGDPEGDARVRVGELLAADDPLVQALGAERVVPIRWVGTGRLEQARRDELLERLSAGPSSRRLPALLALLDGAEADALLAYERLLVLETEPDTRQQAQDLQLLMQVQFALRSRLDGDGVAPTLLRQVLCGRLVDPATLPPFEELNAEQLRLLAFDCLGEPARSVPSAIRPWPTLRLLQRQAGDAELTRALVLVETVRRDRVARDVLGWLVAWQQLWNDPSAVIRWQPQELAEAPPALLFALVPAWIERSERELPFATALTRLLETMRRARPAAGWLPFLPDLAGSERWGYQVSALLVQCEPVLLAAEIRAARLDTARMCRWMDLLLAPTGDSRQLLDPLIPLLVADAAGWPAAVQGSFVLFGAEARVPVACWPAMLAVDDVVVRRRAAQAAWRHHAFGGPSMSALGAALRDSDDQVVQHAASFFLPRRGVDVDRDAAICELLASCDAAPANGRARILGVLGMLDARGEPVEAAARRALAADAPQVQVEAASLLLRQAPADEARQRALGALLEVDDLAARRDALFAAGNLGEAAMPFVEIACRQLRCADEGVAAAAARLLSRIPSIAAVARVELEKRRAEVGERSSLGQRLTGYLGVIDRH